MLNHKLYLFQPIDDAIDAIRSSGFSSGYVTKPCGYYLIIIDQLSFGMLRVQDVGDDKYVNWQTEIPFSNVDTVGYLIQRARNKAGI